MSEQQNVGADGGNPISSSVGDDGNRLTYAKIAVEAEKPFAERAACVLGRRGEYVKPRKHHLKEIEKQKLVSEAAAIGRKVVNPYAARKNLYYAQVEALIELGIDEWHSYKSVEAKITEILSSFSSKDASGNTVTVWDKVSARSSKRVREKAKDIRGRIIQNYRVLQRVKDSDANPYGIKLAQFGMMISIEFRLNEYGVAVPFFKLRADLGDEESVLSWVRNNGGPDYKNSFVQRGRRKKAPVVESIEVEAEVAEATEAVSEASTAVSESSVVEAEVTDEELSSLIDDSVGAIISEEKDSGTSEVEEIKSEVELYDEDGSLIDDGDEDLIVPDARHNDFED